MATFKLNKNELFSILNSFAFSHAFSMSIAIILAICANYYFAFSQHGWIILAAFLVGQTTRGTPLRQGLTFFFTMSIAVLLITCLCLIFPTTEVFVLIVIFFVVSLFVARMRQRQGKNFFLLIVFALTMLAIIPVLSQQTWQAVRMQIVDILIGSGIAILCNQFIFRIGFAHEFSIGVTPVLVGLIDYANALINSLTKQQTINIEKLNLAKVQVEEILVAEEGMYPEWVYEVGFNPGLRSGFRFFLLTLERVTEIFFSLDYFARRPINFEWMNALAPTMTQAMEKNIELIQMLIAYFSENKFLDTRSDFTSDISELEKSLSDIVPRQLELLDISPDYITLTGLVRDIKDLRELLLQLVMALPGKRSPGAVKK